MINISRVLIPGVAAFALLAAVAQADGAPTSVRHLVYKFNYSTTSDLTEHDSGIGGGPASGMSDSIAGSGDIGTITADVMRVQPDTGLVIAIREDARDTRDAVPATCVVYGNTNVICDPNKKVTEEEFGLLRFLGRNFVDTSQIDAKNHWKIENSGPQVTVSSDFTIQKTDAGALQITESRITKQQGAQAFNASTDGNISYNMDRTVPLSIKEDTMLRESRGMGQYNTQHSQLVLQLTTDSLASKP
jgi:hypothetical protein